MDTINLQQLISQTGVIVALFIVSYFLLIKKGIPALFDWIKGQKEAYDEALKEQREDFKQALTTVTNAFSNQIEKSNAFHENHLDEMRGVKDAIQDLTKSVDELKTCGVAKTFNKQSVDRVKGGFVDTSPVEEETK